MSKQQSPGPTVDDVIDAFQNVPAAVGLVRTPDVIRRLTGCGWSVEQSQAALGLAHDVGAIELRPDSGTVADSPADLALAPKGWRGVPLLYARTLKRGG